MKPEDIKYLTKDHKTAVLLALGETIANKDIGDMDTVIKHLSVIAADCKKVTRQLREAKRNI